jgi:hypothetical protein
MVSTEGTVIVHLLPAAVELEGLTSEEEFLFAGETGGICGSQGKMDGLGLKEQRLEILEGLVSLKQGSRRLWMNTSRGVQEPRGA